MMSLPKKRTQFGFSLVELMVTIAIIGILIAVIYVSFQESRMSTRDKVRQTTLADLQLAVETYRTQTGFYPAQGCGAAGTWATNDSSLAGLSATVCTDFIRGVVPAYVGALPNTARPEGRSFAYRSDGNAYKLIVYQAVEASGNLIGSFSDRYAVCPPQAAGQGGLCLETATNSGIPANARTYAVYSPGAEDW